MLGFDKFFENKTLLYSAGAAAFLVAALLILFIFRLAFGRRLHMPGGGRARQPRLGIVDAFDLDRQRQLVLLRRDNVEHLVMIGGPNDLLIESQIVRAEARDVQRPREKEPTVTPLPWPAGGSVSSGQAPSIPSEPKLPPSEEPAAAAKDAAPSLVPVTPPSLKPVQVTPPMAPVPPAAAGASGTAPAVSAPPAGGPAPRPPFLPVPPRRPITTPSFNFKPGGTPPVAPPAGGAEGSPLAAQAPGSSLPPLRPPGPPSSPSFLRPPRPMPPAASSAAPSPAIPRVRPVDPPPVDPVPVSSVPVAPAPVNAPEAVPPRSQEAEADKTAKQADALESLEEEMAKLLGRPSKES